MKTIREDDIISHLTQLLKHMLFKDNNSMIHLKWFALKHKHRIN